MEASMSGKRSNGFMSQFRADVANIISLMLRFYMLIIRVNIYDTVEDVLDTYYVFIGDFDDDEYVNELFFSLHGTLFFTMDNHDDRSFMYEDESDFSYDLYYLYYVL
jgi:calcineurin-like phosphoesterase family protein